MYSVSLSVLLSYLTNKRVHKCPVDVYGAQIYTVIGLYVDVRPRAFSTNTPLIYNVAAVSQWIVDMHLLAISIKHSIMKYHHVY